ncbi:hypothetical protein [Microbulbifer thermotolerans]|uniref:hypothetical protein n=1 Tax=Microbulbifer thermotolerans TaxID=252514 RepID=UPI001C31CE6F|nr:hypothetical protein [Microbulbifer thermotolerans]
MGLVIIMELPQLKSNKEYIKVLYERDLEGQKSFYREEVKKLCDGLEVLLREFDLADDESIENGRNYIFKSVESNYWSGYIFIEHSLRESERIIEDWFEGFLDPECFSELIRKISNISRNRFNPENIECDIENSRVNFTIDGDEKSIPFVFTGGPVCDDFLDEVFALLRDRGIHYRLENDVLFILPDEFVRIANENRYLSIDSGSIEPEFMSEEDKALARKLYEEEKEREAAEYWANNKK